MKFAAILPLLFLTACSATFQNKVDFNPTEPLRVAVLPFSQVDDKGNIISDDPNIFLDKIALVSRKLEDTPPVYVQKLVQSELQRTGLDLVTPALVGAQLAHHGFGKAPLYNQEKITRTSAKELCELLSCDALLFGTVTAWDRSYYGIQSVATVGVDLKLVRAADGKQLFTASGKDSDSRGLTKGPTGFSSLVLEPIRGLDNDIIAGLAQRTVATMLKPLALQNRPEYLNSSPPAIFASSHDVNSGEISRKSPMTVVLLGTGKKSASFSIGKAIEEIPMIEKDAGHYIGEYYPLEIDHFQDEPVAVYLTDEFGRTTEQKVGVGPVSLK